MGRFKYIRADVYRRGITVLIGTKEELLSFVKEAWPNNKELINSVEEDMDNSTSLGTTYPEEDGQSLIWLPKFPKKTREVGALAHEILHATFIMLDYVGVEYRYGGANEPYTYLFESLLSRALNEKGYKEFKVRK